MIHNNDTTKAIWQNLPDYGKTDYLTRQPPGNEKVNDSNRLLSFGNSTNFCIVSTKIYKIDWLKLSRNGHQRAEFIINSDSWEGKWLIP